MIIIFLIIQGFIFGFFTQALATAKGYDEKKYFWFGFFFSFIGLLFVLGIPSRKSDKNINNEIILDENDQINFICPHCNARFITFRKNNGLKVNCKRCNKIIIINPI